MSQFNELIIAFATGFLAVAVGNIVKAVKEYLLQRGGEKAVKIAEILAKNAVHAVEQVATETGYKGDKKLEQAKVYMISELKKYNVTMTDRELEMFVESAVKQMNDAWRG
ncbi:phage holin, LL-H family [Streptococcus mitis]|uniref:Phage holin protein (Holin_LLH) n=1 Tax=Streptococcus mitis TaxID=28037 RepID=A0A081PN72_STRMT|nr:phage holin [Streptococcus mitis]KEQ32145.1 phage holin, LL-H family [Streptococcus mitis]KJQ73346.1 Phage holin protein (Holin_LLH) [Streptococcus mitis]QBX26539.1 holin [Streptococcus phage Javan330]